MWLCCTEKGTHPGPLPPRKYALVTWALWDTRLTAATGHNLSLLATAHRNLSPDTEAAQHHRKRVKRQRPRGQEGQSGSSPWRRPGPAGEGSNSGRAQHRCRPMQEGNSRVQRERKAGRRQARAARGRPREAAHCASPGRNQETGAHLHSQHRSTALRRPAASR